MQNIPVTDKELSIIRKLIYEWAGISMSEHKRSLIAARLIKRLAHYKLHSFTEYINLVLDKQHEAERQLMLDILTTNETYFFREKQHLDFLAEELKRGAANRGHTLRIWSAASSTGEEAYGLAIICAEALGIQGDWEILATDINETVLQKGIAAIYSTDRIENFPVHLMKKYCLKGTGEYEGKIAIKPELKEKVSFRQVNLIGEIPALGLFDFIFLRNVLIYFDNATKTKVVDQVYNFLRPDGFLITGLAESILHLSGKYTKAGASINRRVSR